MKTVPGRPGRGLALLVCSPLFWAVAFADEPAPGSQTIRLRGEVVCLDAQRQPTTAEDGCRDPAGGFALRSADGKLHSFLVSDPRAEMLGDPRVRQQLLQIEGWPRDDDAIEIVHIYTVKNGKLYKPYYRCDTCNITAYAPGPCWCCHQPFELRETPVEDEP